MPWFLAVTTDYFCTYVTRKTTWLELGFRIARLKTLTGSFMVELAVELADTELYWPTPIFPRLDSGVGFGFQSWPLRGRVLCFTNHCELIGKPSSLCQSLRPLIYQSKPKVAINTTVKLFAHHEIASSVIRMSTLTLNPMRKLCVETKSKLRVRFWVTLG